MARKHEPLEVVDSSGLTDDDWAKINRLRHLHESGGSKALSKEFDELREADPITFMHIMSAFFPDMVRETIKGGLAEVGITEDDVRELIQKLAGSELAAKC
jgi:hypothetical protein